MAENFSGGKAKIYIGDEAQEVEISDFHMEGQPLYGGVDLGGDDQTSLVAWGKRIAGDPELKIAFVATIDAGYDIRPLVEWLSAEMARVLGCSVEEARQCVTTALGVDSYDIDVGHRSPLGVGKLIEDARQLKPYSKAREEYVGPLKDVRSTKDATPWTHKREPWQAHRPKRRKR
ncbi:hypothetical protein [Pleomorphomonas sp. PLEO]|uniref:hypothetical protein n=1 Tax=Pleomorphomonas sp. PLEO TaxID=3239306 RepID=UPI00351E869D